jgi:excisionase family DNA binding protein
MSSYITVPEAARRLGITRQAVHKLVQLGRMRADKIGRDWLIIPEPALIPEAGITAPGNRIKTPVPRRPRRLGFSLVEVALSLGIAGLALVSMEQGADDANRQIKDAAAADRITQVYDAAEQYLAANPGLAGTLTVGTPVQLAVGRTSATGAIPSPSLQSLGFLPANYIDSNPYGQTHLVVLRAEANNVVEALVQTVGGTTIPDVDLGRISAKVGANGGGG